MTETGSVIELSAAEVSNQNDVRTQSLVRASRSATTRAIGFGMAIGVVTLRELLFAHSFDVASLASGVGIVGLTAGMTRQILKSRRLSRASKRAPKQQDACLGR